MNKLDQYIENHPFITPLIVSMIAVLFWLVLWKGFICWALDVPLDFNWFGSIVGGFLLGTLAAVMAIIKTR